MEAKDVSYKMLCNFLDTLTNDYWNSIQSEADTRKKIIDKIFSEILGWPEQEIHLESQAGKGFIDYRLTINGLNRVIVEAKRQSRELGISNKYAGRFFKLNGSIFKTEASQEGIEQAINYCAYKNAELACITNGKQWFVFRGNRVGDGKDTLEGVACCFGTLEAVRDQFSLFFDLLSYDAVAVSNFRAIFQEAEGQPLRNRSFRSPIRSMDSRIFLQSDKLSADLDRIMLSFFQDISGGDDPEARKACFVSTDESRFAEQDLIRVSDELRNKVRGISGKEGQEITDAIKRVKEMGRKELVLLVGTKGAGKTTFIDRFFSDVLPADVAKDCVIVRIDLADCGCTSDTIIKWLDENFLDVVENAAFKGNSPEYEDLMGMYWAEYNRWRKGVYKHLYESDKQQFKIKFGEHIERRREERPHEYITHLLHRIVVGHSKVPCIVFDNADHFDVKFQEEIFKYAHSLYRESLCMIIVPITDTTSWQLSKDGAMQSFYTDSYYLPTPPTELILRKRIEFIEEKIKNEKPEKGTGYFLGRGISLEVSNIRAFTSCLQTVFLNTAQVANWIGRLANQDIRRSLLLTREIIASPHIKVHELLEAFLLRSAVDIQPDNIKLAIIRGKYDIYSSSTSSFVQNIFFLVPNIDTSPLLGIRILFFLKNRWEQNKDNDARYINTEDICSYMHVIGIELHVTVAWLNAMLNTGLILSYNPLIKAIGPTTRIEISPSGRQHLQWGLEDWIYIESMSEITSLLSEETKERLSILLSNGSPHLKREAIEIFIRYVLIEDSHYCTVPNHDQYKEQHMVKELVQRQVELARNPMNIGGQSRYTRIFGQILIYYENKGFGFIKPNSGGSDIFFHINEIGNGKNEEQILPGVNVEYEIMTTEKGIRATNVILVN